MLTVSYRVDQVLNKMAIAANVDWIKDGPRHSFVNYRYRDFFD